MDKLLTSDEIYELTGAKLPTKQRIILDQAGINYVQRADGRPSLTWNAVNSVIANQGVDKVVGPNWEAVEKWCK